MRIATFETRPALKIGDTPAVWVLVAGVYIYIYILVAGVGPAVSRGLLQGRLLKRVPVPVMS